MRSLALTAVIGATILLQLPMPALAQLPEFVHSTFDSVIGVSPVNFQVPPRCKYRFEGILRDGNGNPVPHFPASLVELDFSECLSSSTRPFDQIPADEDSDEEGRVYWENGLGFGGADPCRVLVLVQNVPFHIVPGHRGLPGPLRDGGVRSPDADGRGSVGLPDLGALQTEFFNTGIRQDYIGDLAPPFDGQTNLADLGMAQCHAFPE
jgi:hypothetical protein